MAEHRYEDAEEVLARDLQSLRRDSDRDLPNLADTSELLAAAASATSAARNESPHPTREGIVMQSVRFLRLRPWLTTAAATAVVLGVLFVIPISFERTTGHDVKLALTRPASLDAPVLRQLAGEFRSALGADGVRVSQLDAKTELVARVPSRSRTDVERTAAAFATVLTSRGIPADARVAPHKERVSSNVYAMAMNQVVELRIERAGRSPQEIEADIRAQLEAAGIQNPDVTVTQEGGQTQIQIQAHKTEGQEQRDFQVKLQASGDEPLNPKMHEFRVERRPGMTDADVKAEIERQMREAGVEGTVTVENGQVRVQIEKHETKP